MLDSPDIARSDRSDSAGLVVFGDDWGVHPSTTQHLARALLPSTRIVWIDSIGMRSVRADPSEMAQIIRRIRTRLASDAPRAASARVMPDIRLTIPVVPLHRLAAARAVNRILIRRALLPALARLGLARPLVLTSNPVAIHYLDVVAPSAVAYLKVDDYSTQPGVEAALIAETEPAMTVRADVFAATARTLLPAGHRNQLYVPQGVDLAHFARAPLEPPRSRVLGFFGLIATWMDAEFIVAAARRMPHWTFEFVGPKVDDPSFLAACPNIVWRGPVAFEDLPEAVARWDAAWLPRRVTDFTVAMNPLKLREYLAAGLPTFTTPLPELSAYGTELSIGRTVHDLERFLAGPVATDSRAARLARRASVAGQSWDDRARELMSALSAARSSATVG